jgi:hypothetical protein
MLQRKEAGPGVLTIHRPGSAIRPGTVSCVLHRLPDVRAWHDSQRPFYRNIVRQLERSPILKRNKLFADTSRQWRRTGGLLIDDSQSWYFRHFGTGIETLTMLVLLLLYGIM